MKNILIVHYNTPELTLATIKSVRKHTPGCYFYVFDNSDKYPFVPDQNDICVFDNTKGAILNFKKIFKNYKNFLPTRNNQASAQHILSVDWCFDHIPDNFCLLDSDVLLKKDISGLFKNNICATGMLSLPKKLELRQGVFNCSSRFYPFLLYINLNYCKKHNIRFSIPFKLWKLEFTNNQLYDTGAGFYEELISKRVNFKVINIKPYIVHFGGGSYKKTKEDAECWLDLYKNLYN